MNTYFHQQLTDGGTYREAVGTERDFAALAAGAQPEFVTQTFSSVQASSWADAMRAFGFKPGDPLRLGR